MENNSAPQGLRGFVKLKKIQKSESNPDLDYFFWKLIFGVVFMFQNVSKKKIGKGGGCL